MGKANARAETGFSQTVSLVSLLLWETTTIKGEKKEKKERERGGKGAKKKRKKAVVFFPQQEPQCEQPLSDKVRVGGWASLSLFLRAWGSQQRPYALILDIFSLLSSLQHASSSIKQY